MRRISSAFSFQETNYRVIISKSHEVHSKHTSEFYMQHVHNARNVFLPYKEVSQLRSVYKSILQMWHEMVRHVQLCKVVVVLKMRVMETRTRLPILRNFVRNMNAREITLQIYLNLMLKNLTRCNVFRANYFERSDILPSLHSRRDLDDCYTTLHTYLRYPFNLLFLWKIIRSFALRGQFIYNTRICKIIKTNSILKPTCQLWSAFE